MATDKQKRRAVEAGSALGTVGGAVAGYKGVKAVHRVKRGASWGRSAYKMSRKDLGSGRMGSSAAATRVAASGVRGPKRKPTAGAVVGGYLGGVTGSYGGGVAGEQLSERFKYTKKPVEKRVKPLMSEGEQRRRQKLQGKIGRTTSTLGLAGAGLAGTGALLAHKPGALAKIPKLKNADPEKLKNAAFHTGIASGGIGGVGGFNQASIYSAEARRRNQPVKKDAGMDMGYYGEEGRPLSHEEIEAEIAKAWEPTTRQYDPEAKRHKRSKDYETGLTGAAGGLAGGAGVYAGKAVRHEVKNRKAGRDISGGFENLKVKATPVAGRAKAVKSGKVAAGLAGASAAGGIGAALVHRQRKGSWQSYAKRDDVSAFGVDHSDSPNGQHRETEN